MSAFFKAPEIRAEPMPEAMSAEASRLGEIFDASKCMIGRAAVALSLAAVFMTAEATVIDPRPAMAETGGYPDWDAADCSSQFGQYSWCKDENGNGSYSSSEQYSPPGYSYKNCTDWVAWRIPGLVQAGVPAGWGNAKQWDEKAAAAGYVVDTSPEVGDIAVWNSGLFGHVEVVESVNANGTVNTSGYNKAGTGLHGTQSNVTADKYIDLNGTGAGGSGSGETPPANTGIQMILDGAGQVWAKNSVGYGQWTQETPPGIVAIAAGDNSQQLILDNIGQVWARNTVGYYGNGGWTLETPPGEVAIAAGS